MGLQPQLRWLSDGKKGFGQGRRNGCESQDVLSRWVLGNLPPMPVPQGTGKWRKSGISPRRPRLLADASHSYPVIL